MTKEQFLETLAKLYRVANASDSENAESWTTPDMASTICRPLDQVVNVLIENGVFPPEMKDQFAELV